MTIIVILLIVVRSFRKVTLDTINVFVYGTLKPGEANYPYYCAGKVVEEKQAIAWGQLYHLSLGYPGMVSGEGRVYGFLLTFADASILNQLDGLEDYVPDRKPEENEYNREQVEVYDLKGRSLGMAWVYLMSLEKVRHFKGVLIPSGRWSGTVVGD